MQAHKGVVNRAAGVTLLSGHQANVLQGLLLDEALGVALGVVEPMQGRVSARGPCVRKSQSLKRSPARGGLVGCAWAQATDESMPRAMDSASVRILKKLGQYHASQGPGRNVQAVAKANALVRVNNLL